MKFVPTVNLFIRLIKDGWTLNSITKGAESIGYPHTSHGILERGSIDLIEYFCESSRIKLVEEMNQIDLSAMGTTSKVRIACQKRLNMLQPHVERWPEALALLALPQNIPFSFSTLSKLIDSIWIIAGDKSHDMNWYTKRALLSAVYTSTELYMTQDASLDFTETMEFLDR